MHKAQLFDRDWSEYQLLGRRSSAAAGEPACRYRYEGVRHVGDRFILLAGN
jgi:hypothetical protein